VDRFGRRWLAHRLHLIPTSPKLPSRATIRAQTKLADIAMYPGRLRWCTIVTEHAAGYKTTWRSAAECLIFDTSPPSLSGPQSLSFFFKHRVHCRRILRLAADSSHPGN
jgi:hypothetical protein